MSDSITAATANALPNINDIRSKLNSAAEKVQMELISQLANCGEPGIEVLIEFLQQRLSDVPRLPDGKAYCVLRAADSARAKEFLQANLPQGIVPLKSERGIDYYPLQQLLAAEEFLLADRITLEKLCELAGTSAIQRKWLYFTEVESFPVVDLQTIDNLWRLHSEGKFGFSVQRQMWLEAGKKWDKLWDKIGWKTSNRWTRYPQEFTWDLSAPKGHLPLSNQLRGVRVIASLLAHPAWQS